MAEQSKLLTRFYRDYLEWIERGAFVEDPIFSRNVGLCSNLVEWCIQLNVGNYAVLDTEMQEQFCLAFPEKVDARGKVRFPFNNDKEAYRIEGSCDSPQCHTNSARIQWVRDHTNPKS